MFSHTISAVDSGTEHFNKENDEYQGSSAGRNAAAVPTELRS